MNSRYEWERVYAAAVLETEHSKLSQRVEEAQAAIQARMDRLNMAGMGRQRGATDEKVAIEFAINCLKVLEREMAEPKRRCA
jgi:hypothetical protein